MIAFLPFFLPFVVITKIGVGSVFEFPKVMVFESIVLLEVMRRTIPIRLNKGLLLDIGRSAPWLVLLGGMIIYHLLFSQTDISFFGNVYRHQGALLLILLVFFTLFIRGDRMSDLSIGTAAIVTAFALAITTVFLGFVEESGRYVGTLGDANSLAATALFVWPLTMLTHPKRVSRTLLRFVHIGVFLCVLTVVSLSWSRSGWIGFTLEAILLLITCIRGSLSLRIIPIILVMMSALLIFPFVYDDNAVENRATIWKTAFSAGFTKPLLGNGFGNIEYGLRTSSYRLENNLRYVYVDSSHNLILDWWVQGGIVGVLVIISIVYTTLSNLLRTRQVYVFISYVGLLTMALFNPLSVAVIVQWWWIVGLSISMTCAYFVGKNPFHPLRFLSGHLPIGKDVI